jgi:ribonuclease BN (tRNA processing enzyme)
MQLYLHNAIIVSKQKKVYKMYKNSIRILGAYGTKAKGFGTTSFMLNSCTVIDAGNLIDALAKESLHVENIYLTHSHLDHISDIAYIIDNYFCKRSKTVNIIALPQTIQALKEHFFNDIIWPDFSKIYLENSETIALKYSELRLNTLYSLDEQTTLMPIQTDHTVPSCGYIYKVNERGVLITADTYSLENIIEMLNSDKEIKSFVVECSFSSNMQTLAEVSKHLTPKLLFDGLKNLTRDDISLYIHHIKPSCLDKITAEIEEIRGKFKPIILKDGDFITF